MTLRTQAVGKGGLNTFTIPLDLLSLVASPSGPAQTTDRVIGERMVDTKTQHGQHDRQLRAGFGFFTITIMTNDR